MITVMKNMYGSEYIWLDEAKKKNERSVQIISSTGRRRMGADDKESALKVEYLVYMKMNIWNANSKNTKFYLIEEVFNFINFYLSGESDKSRELAVNALKVLYTYLYLFNIRLDSMSYDDARMMLDFISGGGLHDNDDMRIRDNSTVAAYLSYIRKYVRYLGGNQLEHPLLSSSLMQRNNADSSHPAIIRHDIRARRTTDKITSSIKYHITPDEYLRLRDTKNIRLSEHDRLLSRCIIDLMFLQGLRIGEVLGLTLEDFYQDNTGDVCITIRNRYSNRKYQNAKGVISISRLAQYTSRDYRRLDVGYQVVYLEQQVIQDIAEYIALMHDFIRNRKDKMRYKQRTVADTVSTYLSHNNNNMREQMHLSDVQQISIDGKNHYLFLNSSYGRLTDTRWNQILRSIFMAEHIGIDYGCRNFGLNHRFRHGFAIVLIYMLHMDVHSAQKLLRHKSINSIEPYLRLTIDDVRDMRAEYTRNIFDLLNSEKEGED